MNAAAEDQIDLDKLLIEAIREDDEIEEVIDLLNRGANPNALNTDFYAIPLHAAILENRIDVAEELLKKGADVNGADRFGWTPLMSAAWKNNPDMTKLLLDRGANTDLKDAQGQTAKAVAANCNCHEIINILEDCEDTPTTKNALD